MRALIQFFTQLYWCRNNRHCKASYTNETMRDTHEKLWCDYRKK